MLEIHPVHDQFGSDGSLPLVLDSLAYLIRYGRLTTSTTVSTIKTGHLTRSFICTLTVDLNDHERQAR